MHCVKRPRTDGNRGLRLPILALLVGASITLPAVAHAREKVAVVISQAVGVGPLADHLGNLTAEHLEKGAARVIGPGEAVRLLRERGEPEPEACGSDVDCLRQLARALEARWVVAVGVGSFGEIFSLELRCVEEDEAVEAVSTSATYAAPGPDWGQALRERLEAIVPKRLLHSRGSLFIQSREVGAEIRVNDLAAGTVPLAQPLRLPEGRYTVEIRHAGQAAARETVEIRAGEKTELQLDFLTIGPSSTPLRTYGYIGAGTSEAALATAIGLHISASAAMEEARDLQHAGKPFADERSTALRRMTGSRIAYGLAGAAAIATGILLYLDYQETLASQ